MARMTKSDLKALLVDARNDCRGAVADYDLMQLCDAVQTLTIILEELIEEKEGE